MAVLTPVPLKRPKRPHGRIIFDYEIEGRTIYIDPVVRGNYIQVKTIDLWHLAKVPEKELGKVQSVRILVTGPIVFSEKEESLGYDGVRFIEVRWPLQDVEYQYLQIN